MVYSLFNVIIVSSSLIITSDKDASSNYLIKIKTLSVAFLVLMLISAKTIDRFSAVLSVSARFFV
jgi:hypothetical protein